MTVPTTNEHDRIEAYRFAEALSRLSYASETARSLRHISRATDDPDLCAPPAALVAPALLPGISDRALAPVAEHCVLFLGWLSKMREAAAAVEGMTAPAAIERLRREYVRLGWSDREVAGAWDACARMRDAYVTRTRNDLENQRLRFGRR